MAVASEEYKRFEAVLLGLCHPLRRCSGCCWLRHHATYQLPQPSVGGSADENARSESLDTNARYVAALRGETLTRTPYQRIQPVPKQNVEKMSNNNEKA
ncbi:hypothetical protein CXB51_007442 [Gossypium anomalum]|uniref:Uncharacterized protein n=1 Tax=Gossypium anomalum TaxID=47600 RepID=A0A8J5Z1C0_9ROSI|nr:hypothetical protein CXB51_007442 [Gossypium anomalum]